MEILVDTASLVTVTIDQNSLNLMLQLASKDNRSVDHLISIALNNYIESRRESLD